MGRATQGSALDRLHRWRGIAALTACTMLGACAQSSKPSLPVLLSQQNEAAAQAAPDQTAAAGKSELMKATEYWGKEYAKEPRSLKAALSYARNLKALGEKKRALAVLQQASIIHGDSRELAGEYGRLALEFDQVSLANRLLAAADDPVNPDWRVISARGTVLAKQGKYKEAIPFYERALTFAHDQPSLLSNLALAHAMSGDPKRAEELLRQAAAGDRNSLKIRQNLALVLGLQGKYDEAKLLASHDMSAENAAEDTNYLRRIVKLKPEEAPAADPTHAVAEAPPFRVEVHAEPSPKVAQADPMPPLPQRKGQMHRYLAKANIGPFKSSLRTSKPQHTMTVTPAALRGTVSPTSAKRAEQRAEAPKTPSNGAAGFSVAQWMPQTEPATVENEPLRGSEAK